MVNVATVTQVTTLVAEALLNECLFRQLKTLINLFAEW
ncbi:Unknown protein sequence [Pseudomonas amygdali pv. morsprunorum]|nr:hypothetical protein AC519_3056 [Pseudomonas savastanoi]KPB60728.1 Unknown protein sequence [Pseudomonas amygdali pv. myricae]KPC46613.1 Unknown protein sequence [Pseudomonas amygdali pv. morsprunorum]